MLKTIDDKFARNLASYLKDNEMLFLHVSLYERPFVEEEELYELIKQFRQELP